MNKKLMSEFSKWLKQYRAESGLTLMQLKSAIGDLCSDAYLSQLENNRYKGKKGEPSRPALEIVDALAKALNRPIDEARLAAGYSPLKPMPQPIIEAIAQSGNLSDEDYELTANFIRMLNDQKK